MSGISFKDEKGNEISAKDIATVIQMLVEGTIQFEENKEEND